MFLDYHAIRLRILTGKSHPQIKLQSLQSTNMYLSAIGTLNQLFIRNSYTDIKFSKKWSSRWLKSISVLYGNVALSFVVLWIKKQYSSFLRKVLVFPKTSFKFKVLKNFKIPGGWQIKTRRSLKRRAISKIPSTAF